MPVTFQNIARSLAHNAISFTGMRLPSRAGHVLLAGLLGSGLSAGLLVAGALAASVVPAQAPLTVPSLQMHKTTDIAAMQPLPPLPDQPYDAQFHEGSVDLDSPANFAGIDPFITGPVPQ